MQHVAVVATTSRGAAVSIASSSASRLMDYCRVFEEDTQSGPGAASGVAGDCLGAVEKTATCIFKAVVNIAWSHIYAHTLLTELSGVYRDAQKPSYALRAVPYIVLALEMSSRRAGDDFRRREAGATGTKKSYHQLLRLLRCGISVCDRIPNTGYIVEGKNESTLNGFIEDDRLPNSSNA